MQAACRDLTREAAEIQMRTVDPLHRQPEGLFGQGLTGDRRLFQMGQQARALIPWHGI